MNRKTTILLIVCFTILLNSGFCQEISGNNWKQFRGNTRDASTEISNLNTSWENKKPELVWKKKLGDGFSEVLIQNDKVYTMTSEKTDSISGFEYVIVLNAKTGEEVWKTKVDSLFFDESGFGDGPRSTPAIDSKYIFSLSSYGKLSALSIADGSVLWATDFMKEFGSILPRWAFCSSPLILESTLIIEVGGGESKGFASVNKATGEIIWLKGNAVPYYGSPTVAKINGQNQILFTSDSMLISYDTNGNVLWKFRMPLRFPTATPLFIAPNKVFVSSAGRNGGCLIEIIENKATEVFQTVSMKNHFSTSVSCNGYIFGYSNAAFRCISAKNGEIKWTKRGLGKGTVILVNDKLLVLSDKGVLKLVEANPDVYSELGSFQALTGKSWTAPSVANGNVYLRNLTEIASFKISE